MAVEQTALPKQDSESIGDESLHQIQAEIRNGGFTSLDKIILGIYPLTLLLGFCFSLGHSTSYFAHSHNIFNLLFVKNGWLWTTIVFWCHIYRLPVSNNRIRQAVIRWLISTLIWMLVTQWAFGAPLTDRTMIWTGGVCALAKKGTETNADIGTATQRLAIMTNKACREARGHWEGGHDLSGHVFILTHSSLFLWYEILPLLLKQSSMLNQNATKAAITLIAGWWWMLLMTAAYFHTWKEKLTGLFTGVLGWMLVYKVAPRIASLRSIIGVPHA